MKYTDSALDLWNCITEIGTETQFWKKQEGNATLLSKSNEWINIYNIIKSLNLVEAVRRKKILIQISKLFSVLKDTWASKNN